MHQSRVDEQKESAPIRTTGLSELLTPGQRACLIDLLEERVQTFNSAVERRVAARAAKVIAKPGSKVGSTAKKVGSWISAKLGALSGRGRSGAAATDVEEVVDPSIPLKKRYRDKFFKKSNAFLMEHLKANYIYIVSSEHYPNLELVFDAGKLIYRGDAYSALIELKLLVSSISSNKIKRRLQHLQTMVVHSLVDGVLESHDDAAAAGGGGGGEATRPIQIVPTTPWNREDFSRSMNVNLCEPLG